MSGPGYPDLPVPCPVRFTWSGSYAHDACWPVGEGDPDVGHGCINLPPGHAAIYCHLARAC